MIIFDPELLGPHRAAAGCQKTERGLLSKQNLPKHRWVLIETASLKQSNCKIKISSCRLKLQSRPKPLAPPLIITIAAKQFHRQQAVRQWPGFSHPAGTAQCCKMPGQKLAPKQTGQYSPGPGYCTHRNKPVNQDFSKNSKAEGGWFQSCHKLPDGQGETGQTAKPVQQLPASRGMYFMAAPQKARLPRQKSGLVKW